MSFIENYVPKFICNTKDQFDWVQIINNIELQGGHPNFLLTGNVEEDQSVYKYFTDEKFLPTDNHDWGPAVVRAGYNWKTVRWTDYEMVEIDPDLVKKFGELVGAKYLRCFISKVEPGVAVAMHWDEGDVQYRTPTYMDKIYRYTCFIDRNNIGQTFLVDGHCFHNEEQGNIYEWGHYTNFHGSYNVSGFPHYIFHYLGYKE